MKSPYIGLGLLAVVILLRVVDKPPQATSDNSLLTPLAQEGLIIEIGNASPDTTKFVFKGASSEYSFTLPPCKNCQVYESKPSECPTNTVFKTFWLKREVYKVEITAINSKTKFFSGSRDFSNRKSHSECFYNIYNPANQTLEG